MVILLGRSVWSLYQKDRITAYYRDRAAAELEKFREQKSQLAADVSNLKTDRGLEEEIRKNLPVVKDGEQVITVIDPDQPETDQSETDEDQPGFWAKVMAVFGY